MEAYHNANSQATENFARQKTPASKYEVNRVFTLNDPNAPRLCPGLAAEIGLNESILFLQLEFLIAVSKHTREGQRWTYQSLTDLQEMFPFWSRSTINRTIESLEKTQELILSTDKFNKLAWDKTRWFTINFEKIKKLQQGMKLQSIALVEQRVKLCLDETTPSQNGTTPSQNGTTIPETTPETTPETSSNTQYTDDANASSNLFRGVCRNKSGGEDIQGERERAAPISSQSSKKTTCPELATFLDGEMWAWARDEWDLGPAGIVHITRQFLRERIKRREWDEARKGLWRNCVENRAQKNPHWQTAESFAFLGEDWWHDAAAASEWWLEAESAEWDKLWTWYNELELECALREHSTVEDGDVARYDLSDAVAVQERTKVENAIRDHGWKIAQRLRQQEEAA